MKKSTHSLTLAASILLATGLFSTTLHADAPPVGSVLTKETQAAMTPADAVARLKAGNERFASGVSVQRDLLAEAKATSSGQYPFAAVVSCIDSRASSEIIFDQGLGDIFNARLAGNVADEDVLGSVEFATKVAGAKLIAVIGHSSCGAVKGAADKVKLGNLTKLLDRIEPAVASTKTDAGADRTSKNHDFIEHVTEANVRLQMENIREHSEVIKDLLDKGQIALVGGVYDLETGKVHFLDEKE